MSNLCCATELHISHEILCGGPRKCNEGKGTIAFISSYEDMNMTPKAASMKIRVLKEIEVTAAGGIVFKKT